MNIDGMLHLFYMLKQNIVASWLVILILSFFVATIAKAVIKTTINRFRLITSKAKSIFDDLIVELFDNLKYFYLFILSLFLLAKNLHQSEFIARMLFVLLVIGSIIQLFISGQLILRHLKEHFLNDKIKKDPSSAAAIGLLYRIIQVALIIIIILIGLSNLGVDVGALIAGLGVGGIAVALAAQNILGDLLASLSIVLDKPFVVGDFIIVGQEMGTVEFIGIKTTRLRSLSGEELVISNKDILENRIRNYKRMWKRRVVQKFGITYSTPSDVIKKIPTWIKEFIQQYDKLEFDRCHFCNYGASSLEFELVFFVNDSDYAVFMNYQEKVLLDIFEKFNQEKISFAFPTQTIHLAKD